jgi:hypothetical protein
MSSQEWSILTPFQIPHPNPKIKFSHPKTNAIISISSSNIRKYGPDRENQHPPLSWMDGCMDGWMVSGGQETVFCWLSFS